MNAAPGDMAALGIGLDFGANNRNMAAVSQREAHGSMWHEMATCGTI
jgi:hypothetical protein